MSSEEAFRYFLIEYKKRLPLTEENKDFHEHIDYMINYFKTNHSIYQERWDDWISPNDERYWRNPTVEESKLIKDKQDKNKQKTQNGGIVNKILETIGFNK
jgi:hypothetical protein